MSAYAFIALGLILIAINWYTGSIIIGLHDRLSILLSSIDSNAYHMVSEKGKTKEALFDGMVLDVFDQYAIELGESLVKRYRTWLLIHKVTYGGVFLGFGLLFYGLF